MIVLDFEVFKFDWLVVLYDILKKEYKVIVNSKDELLKYYEDHKSSLFITYNGNHYDNIILKAILSDVDPYSVSKLIIEEDKSPGVIEKALKIKSIDIKTCDLIIDMGFVSLKELEAYMGMSIQESQISFDIDRKLTEEEIQETIRYCKHDVDATTKFLESRTGYLKSKFILMKMFNLPKSILNKTSAQIAAMVLQANKIKQDDGLIYDPPKELILNKYRDMLWMYDKELNYQDKYTCKIAGVDHIYAFGGLHGAIPNFTYIGEMWQIDATSYYPTMILEYNYIRNIKDFERYRYIYEERVKQKKLNKDISTALKLILNSTFGAMKAPFNDLFDEHNSNEICISGQLFMTDLIEKIEPYCKLIQTNTDGILVIPYNKEGIMNEIKKFEERTRLKFEIDICNGIWQKDVNNYILLEADGSIKTKGSYVGQYNAGIADRKNMQICDIAIVDYFTKNIPVEKTINDCNDKYKFQIITKTGGTYQKTYWIYKDQKFEVQRVNRVYAVSDTSYGNLVKWKLFKGKDKFDSIANCPEHCYVDNINKMEIDMIDKQWYIDVAKKRINDYLGG